MSKAVPKLRFKEFSEPWGKKTLFDISENVSYGMNSAAIEFDGVHKYIRITDIDIDSGTFKPNPLTSPDGEIEDKFKLKVNDIVFARTGASVGKSYLYNPKDGALYYAGFLIKFSITKANAYFIYSLTLKEAYNKWVHIYSMRSGQPGLNAEEYKALKLNIPSLPEQQKIASFLSAVDEKIQQLTRKKELLEQYKKGVMQQLFSSSELGFVGLEDDRISDGRLEDDGIDDGKNPAIHSSKKSKFRQLRFKDENGKAYPKWEEKKLGDIGKIRMCKRVFNHETSQVGDVPFYKIGTFGKEADAYITLEHYLSFKEKFPFPKTGEILISAAGTLGRTVIYDGRPAYFQDSNIVWIENDEKLVRNSFLYFVYQIVKYDSEGGTIQRLYNNIISNAKFSRPSLEEQQKIANFLSAIDTKIESVATQIGKTQTFKKGLLQQMFV